MMEAIDLHKEVLRVRPFIEPALKYGGDTHDYVHIVNGVISGVLQLWPTENSALVTEFHTFPKKKFLHIFLAGGDLQEIRAMHDDVVQFAKDCKCDGISLNGRPGWVKALADLGFGANGLRYVIKEFSA
jgi:hypothetical protein